MPYEPPVPPPPYFELVDELFEDRTATVFDHNGNRREYVRKFIVITTDPRIAELSVCTAPGIPIPFSPYNSAGGVEVDWACQLVKIRADGVPNSDGYKWIVTCEYSTDVLRGGAPVLPSGQFGNPRDETGGQNQPQYEPAELSIDFEDETRAWPFDRNGETFLNTANQPFVPSPQFPTAFPVITMTRNELFYDMRVAKKYAYAVNDRVFLGELPNRVLCLPPKAQLMFKGNVRYWRVTYRLKIYIPMSESDVNNERLGSKKETWQPDILSQGLCRLQNNAAQPDFNKPIPIMGPTGKITTPDLLGQDGQPVVPDGAGKREGFYCSFTVYRSEDLSLLLQTGLVPGLNEVF